MARTEFPAELQKLIEETGPVDLLIGITGVADKEKLREKVTACAQAFPAKTVVACAGIGEAELAPGWPEGVKFAPYPVPADTGSLAFWADIVAAARSVLALAVAWQARACLMIHSDLAALDPAAIRLLTEPVLEGKNDLVMPIYPEGKYDGLINKGLLAPLSRALYGKRVRAPLAFDLCAGTEALVRLDNDAQERAQGEWQILWPVNTVAMSGGQIGQAAVNFRHAPLTDGFDLSAVLAELAGSLFQQTETRAAYWQRVRGSQPVARYGDPIAINDDVQPIDPRPMVESFVIGSHNLEEVWRLVLPPATVLELKRLTRLDPAQFGMPDALWSRLVYDFALAHRMRRVSRTHVLGALTPLYLGWVASYTQEVAAATAQEADRRIEQLARVYEEQKPYLVSRWRWPERMS